MTTNEEFIMGRLNRSALYFPGSFERKFVGKSIGETEYKKMLELNKFIRYNPADGSYNKMFDKFRELCLDTEKGQFSVRQSEDMEDQAWILLSFGPLVSSFRIIFEDGTEKEPIPIDFFDNSLSLIEFSYSNPVEKLSLRIVENLAGPLDIIFITTKADPVQVEMNKEAAEVQRLEAERQVRLKNLNVNHSVGDDLVNIYFQDSTENVAKIVIDLYVKLPKEDDYRLIAKHNVQCGSLFHSISGLAYGEYAYTLTQYDPKGGLLVMTDRQTFCISPPDIGSKQTYAIWG